MTGVLVMQVVVFLLYAVLLGQVVATVWFYLKALRKERTIRHHVGVLPGHVISVGLVLLWFTGVSVARYVQADDDEFLWFMITTPVALVCANVAVFLISMFEYRRYAHGRLDPMPPESL